MRQKSERHQGAAERTIKDIRRRTRKRYSSEEKIRIVLAGLRGEDSIAELCRQEGIAQGLYYSWSKEFLEAGKKRLAGDTARAANSDEVKDLRRESRDLKEVVAEQALQHDETAQYFRIAPTGSEEHRPHRPKATHALTIKSDHSRGLISILPCKGQLI
jgi:transposase